MFVKSRWLISTPSSSVRMRHPSGVPTRVNVRSVVVPGGWIVYWPSLEICASTGTFTVTVMVLPSCGGCCRAEADAAAADDEAAAAAPGEPVAAGTDAGGGVAVAEVAGVAVAELAGADAPEADAAPDVTRAGDPDGSGTGGPPDHIWIFSYAW